MLFLASCQTRGHIESVDRDSKYLISAPHGDFDSHTGDIVEEVCKAMPWDCLIVRGFRTTTNPINVNRPTKGLRASSEEIDAEAQRVYSSYLAEMRRVSPREPELYVELHGNIRSKSQGRVEIAYVGMTKKRLLRLRRIFESQLDAFGLGAYSVLIEGDPDFYYKAKSAKTVGVLKEVKHALHIEVPVALRDAHREAFTQALIATLEKL